MEIRRNVSQPVRVVNPWNLLPGFVLSSTTVHTFESMQIFHISFLPLLPPNRTSLIQAEMLDYAEPELCRLCNVMYCIGLSHETCDCIDVIDKV